MMKSESPVDDTDALLDRITAGEGSAVGRLLERHRERLCRMVAFRLDSRLAGRLDASDVVQEAMIKAAVEIDNYLERRADVPFYAWLHQLAWRQLVSLYRRHVIAQRRSVRRELPPLLADDTVHLLAERLAGRNSSPSAGVIRKELRARVRTALGDLKHNDREILIMRHLERMSVREISAVMQISASAVKMRHMRAVQRLRDALDGDY